MLTLTVLSPDKKLLEAKKVKQVRLTGSEGAIVICENHQRMVGTLEAGRFGYSAEGEDRGGFISRGFFRVSDNHVTVLAETGEWSSQIDLKRAQASEVKAREALNKVLSERDRQKFMRKLQRAQLRQVVAQDKPSQSH
jgi:ATP synthase F1 epsilon subunit